MHPSPVNEAMGSSIWSSKGPTCEPSSTSLVVNTAATIRPVSASTPCSLRHDRRRLVPCFSIDHSPAPDSFNPVLSTNRCYGLGAGRRSRQRQRLGPPAQRGMVRDSEIETEPADDGADQPFGLPQSQAEHGAQRQRRRDRQGRIVGLTAPRGPWFCAPGLCSRPPSAIAITTRISSGRISGVAVRLIHEVRFAQDTPLEEGGFEPSVPV